MNAKAHARKKRTVFDMGVRTLVAITAGAAVCFSAAVNAATFPERPLTLVVPYAPGATTDMLGRAVGQHMSKDLQKPVVVENKSGANGIIGTTYVTRAAPDGHNILLSTDSSTVLNELLYSNLSYDPRKDITPIGLLSNLPIVMVVSSTLPVNNLAEFVTYAKANPGKLNYGSTGNGGTFHLAAELFSQQAGISMTHVPYKGGSPAVTALMADEIQVLFGVVGSTLSQVEAGRIKALGLAASERLPILPDVPTFKEQGYPEYEVLVRYGLSAPGGTPPEIVERLAASAGKALADPEFQTMFTNLGFLLPKQVSPAEYQKVIEQDRKLWGDLIKTKNITLN